MRKFLIALVMLFGYATSASAIEGVNFGISITAGQFEADGAKEEFKGAHSSSASPGDVAINATTEGDGAEALFGFGSIFIEKTLGDRLAIGIDYVPMTLDTETAENERDVDITPAGVIGSEATNTVQVDFSDLTTLYFTLKMNDNLYVKAGLVEVDVETNESLGTGGAYGDTSLDGHMLAIGFNKDLDTGAFVRLEAHTMSLDGVTLENTNDSTKSITADGVSGYGAKLSIGKSF
tara:strand:- start:854 stop:1558 length:705 start_codon:yes stop_codon:yes gene_type:complete